MKTLQDLISYLAPRLKINAEDTMLLPDPVSFVIEQFEANEKEFCLSCGSKYSEYCHNNSKFDPINNEMDLFKPSIRKPTSDPFFENLIKTNFNETKPTFAELQKLLKWSINQWHQIVPSFMKYAVFTSFGPTPNHDIMTPPGTSTEFQLWWVGDDIRELTRTVNGFLSKNPYARFFGIHIQSTEKPLHTGWKDGSSSKYSYVGTHFEQIMKNHLDTELDLARGVEERFLKDTEDSFVQNEIIRKKNENWAKFSKKAQNTTIEAKRDFNLSVPTPTSNEIEMLKSAAKPALLETEKGYENSLLLNNLSSLTYQQANHFIEIEKQKNYEFRRIEVERKGVKGYVLTKIQYEDGPGA